MVGDRLDSHVNRRVVLALDGAETLVSKDNCIESPPGVPVIIAAPNIESEALASIAAMGARVLHVGEGGIAIPEMGAEACSHL